MSGDLVLITGGTGHVGFRALRFALEHGYQVRAAVRSQAKADAVRSNPALKAMSIPDDRLSFVIVPDILAQNAYDEAAEGVKYIIHIASPLSDSSADGDYENDLIKPAIQGTLSILEAAQKASTVKRIVITSSVIAVTPVEAFTNPGERPRISADERLPETTGPLDAPFKGYAKSKVAALNRSEAWIKKNNPPFDIINIHPSYVEGRNDMNSTVEDFAHGTNRLIVQIATGAKSEKPQAATTNFVDDTALIHVLALKPEIPGNESYLVTSPGDDGMEWNQVKDIVAKHFPDAVKKGILSTDGEAPSFALKYDIEKTERTFGIKLASFETQVISVLKHYVEIYEKEHGLQ